MAKKQDFSAAVQTKLASLRVGNSYNVGAVNKSATSIAGRTATLDVDIHATAVAAVYVSHPATIGGHGDTSGAEKLVNSLGKHTRAKALVSWFHVHSDIVLTFDKKADCFKAKLAAKDDRRSDADLQALVAKAVNEPFWNKPEQADRDFDTQSLAKAVAALIKRAEADLTKLDDDGLSALADLKVLNQKLPVLTKA